MPALTPTDIMALRTSIRWRGSIGEFAHRAAILYYPADDCFGLLADGRVMATSADIRLLGECLRQERAQPGFIRRIMDPTFDCFTASLDPAGFARTVAQQRADAARAKLLAEEAAEIARRRRNAIDVRRLDLDDL